MKSLRILAATSALALSLGGCAKVTAELTKINAAVTTYAPIVGKDLIMVANIIVTAECSPATPVAGQVASNILNIVAPNSSSAKTVQNVLTANAAVAAQLCPLVASIKASVGNVPTGATPSQTVLPAAAMAAPAAS